MAKELLTADDLATKHLKNLFKAYAKAMNQLCYEHECGISREDEEKAVKQKAETESNLIKYINRLHTCSHPARKSQKAPKISNKPKPKRRTKEMSKIFTKCVSINCIDFLSRNVSRENAKSVKIEHGRNVYIIEPEDDGCIKLIAEDILGNKCRLLLIPYDEKTVWLKAEMI